MCSLPPPCFSFSRAGIKYPYFMTKNKQNLTIALICKGNECTRHSTKHFTYLFSSIVVVCLATWLSDQQQKLWSQAVWVWIPAIVPVCPWISYLSSLCLSILICKVGTLLLMNQFLWRGAWSLPKQPFPFGAVLVAHVFGAQLKPQGHSSYHSASPCPSSLCVWSNSPGLKLLFWYYLALPTWRQSTWELVTCPVALSQKPPGAGTWEHSGWDAPPAPPWDQAEAATSPGFFHSPVLLPLYLVQFLWEHVKQSPSRVCCWDPGSVSSVENIPVTLQSHSGVLLGVHKKDVFS